jgi:hypothetical protein
MKIQGQLSKVYDVKEGDYVYLIKESRYPCSTGIMCRVKKLYRDSDDVTIETEDGTLYVDREVYGIIKQEMFGKEPVSCIQDNIKHLDLFVQVFFFQLTLGSQLLMVFYGKDNWFVTSERTRIIKPLNEEDVLEFASSYLYEKAITLLKRDNTQF